MLSPGRASVSFPVYRSKWGNLGTLHRRYAGCNKQVRAKPFKAQSTEYANLEYFHTFMSNDLTINGLAHESNAGREEENDFQKIRSCRDGTYWGLGCCACESADQAAFDAAYAAADAARKGAAKWATVDTKMLKSAKKLADKGKFDKAIALANKAKFQASAPRRRRPSKKLWQLLWSARGPVDS